MRRLSVERLQIVASVLSKKIAAGSTHLILDMPVGPTAKVRNAAAAAGIDEMGTLEAGKSADFVVLEANPLDDIANTRRIDAVYLRGDRT